MSSGFQHPIIGAKSSSSVLQQVRWAPNAPDSFAFLSSEQKDIRLYQYYPATPGHEEAEDVFKLRAIHPEVSARCFEWSVSKKTPLHFVVGLVSGRVVVCNFAPTSPGTTEMIQPMRKIFVPRIPRQCNCVAWNPEQDELIASGFDKARSDNCVMVWDVSRGYTTESAPTDRVTVGRESANVFNEPVWAKDADQCVALSWVPQSQSLLACGFGIKYLKVHDVRVTRFTSSAIPVVQAHNRGVYGVKFDPNNPTKVATFSDDGMIKVWDIKMFHEPVCLINTGCKTISDIAWSPSQPGLITSISREHGTACLWYTQQYSKQTLPVAIYTPPTPAASAGAKPSAIIPPGSVGAAKNVPWRYVKTKQGISAAAWRWTKESKLLCAPSHTSASLSPGSSNFHVISIDPPTPLAWSCRGVIASAQYSSLQTRSVPLSHLDISSLMHRRAIMGYGLDMGKNLEITTGGGGGGEGGEDVRDPQLASLWKNLQKMMSVAIAHHRVEDSGDDDDKAIVVKGVASLMFPIVVKSTLLARGLNTGGQPAALGAMWGAQNSYLQQSNVVNFLTYASKTRTLSATICGYPETPEETEIFIRQLESVGNIERAVFLLLVNLELHRAIDMLSRAGKTAKNGSVYCMAGMAMAGFTGSSLWTDTYSQLTSLIESPYLRASFALLARDSKGVLAEEDVLLSDRLIYASKFLSDDDFLAWCVSVSERCIATGNLEGIIVTGFDIKGVDLIAEFVNRTADVQTGSLLLCAAGGVDAAHTADSRMLQWLSSYRELLDRWQLWGIRARLDINIGKRSYAKHEPQVVARCNMCQASVTLFADPRQARARSAAAAGRDRSMMTMTAGAPRKARADGCPKCCRALPRCALCHKHLGCTNGPESQSDSLVSDDSVDARTSRGDFSNWFSWCQVCRHGGHASHIAEWFATHSVCPVADCQCNCSSRE